MTRILLLLVLACASASLAVGRNDQVVAVLRVAEMLGQDTWTRALWIENRENSSRSRYPARFPAVVFALQGMLWMYTPIDGTQSLSQFSGRLASDQGNLGPLLEAIEPGLRRFSNLSFADEPLGELPAPFACFPRCIEKWLALMNEPVPPEAVRLLNYYMPARSGQKGHSVLEYTQGGRRYVFDPDRPGELHTIADGIEDPLEVVRQVAQQRAARPPSKVMALRLDHDPSAASSPRIAVRREPSAGSNRSTFMR